MEGAEAVVEEVVGVEEVVAGQVEERMEAVKIEIKDGFAKRTGR